ncbi:hypothetical protein [Haloferula sp. BvORR071]|uniref:hypothetical protein n=1 Tax=Haloferula sp. BvORR071 TaxID=1396141 RepID=UPI002240EBB6|nr:hypothetical protein [Haloferula sp. BvORR071]
MRFQQGGRSFIPEDMIGPAELFFLGHLGRENGIDRGIVETVAFPQTLAAGFLAGSHQKIGFLTEVESVLEEKRDVRDKEGRPHSAGGCRRFKTFLADPRMQDSLEFLPRRVIPEDLAAQNFAPHRTAFIQHLGSEALRNSAGNFSRSGEQPVHTSVGIENHRPRAKFPEDLASGRFAAGDPTAQAEHMHAAK